MTVLRFDPFRDFDRLTDQARSRVRVPVLPMDAYRRPHELVLQFDLPGVDPSSVEVTVERSVLTVTAERPTGRFTRQLQLGDGLDADRVAASFDAGVLTITFPVADEVRARRVEVTTGTPAGTPPIEAQSEAGAERITSAA